MKHLYFTVITFITLTGVGLLLTPSAQGAEVVGREAYTISWDRPANAQTFQVFYGQTNTGKKDTTVFNLTSESRSLTLNLLKACTQYNWNVKYLQDGKWSWLWSADKMFTSAGACSAVSASGSKTTTALGNKVTIVGVASATATWTPVNGATHYNIYYRESGSQAYSHSVSTGPNTTAVTINHLQVGTTYYYRVAGVTGGKEIWQAEKMLRQSVPANPVLGTRNSR